MSTTVSHFLPSCPSLKAGGGSKWTPTEFKMKRNNRYNKWLASVSMTLQASGQDAPCITRRFADFMPSTWGKDIVHLASSDSVRNVGDDAKHAEKLKDKIKSMLTSHVTEPSEKMELIDLIQRVGLSYHFEFEISECLQQIYSHFNGEDSLHVTALRFRLLRQHGYYVSCDVFNRFKDREGKLLKSLVNDTQGLLSLYEASYLRVHEEDVLEEALDFTTTNLKSIAEHQTPAFAARITHALKWPIRTSVPRVYARQYLTLYQPNTSGERLVLEFAVNDFNRLQKLHQQELREVMEWRTNWNFDELLSYGRQRTVESYFWALGTYFEPQYSLGRKIVAQMVDFAVAIDDTFDAYGTFEELRLFTEAIDRWDTGTINTLPEYMRPLYKAILDTFNEIEKDMDLAGKRYGADYIKEAMKRQVRTYFEEAKWLHHQYTPTVEEYLEVALVTTDYLLVATSCFLAMGDIATKDVFEWISSRPKVLRCAELILRLGNDITGHKFEQARGHIPSSVECYMKEYDVTEEKAISELRRRITSAWKDINQECLQQTAIPKPLFTPILNLANTAYIFYMEEDAYTNCETELTDIITSLVIDPVVM